MARCVFTHLAVFIGNGEKIGLQPKPESLPHLLIKRKTSTYRKYSLSSNTPETMGKKNNTDSGCRKQFCFLQNYIGIFNTDPTFCNHIIEGNTSVSLIFSSVIHNAYFVE